MLRKNQKEKLVGIGKKYNLDLFILFGSRVENTNNKNSDWDFAIFRKNNPLKFDELIELKFEIIQILENENIDLIEIDLIKTPPQLIFNILNKGKEIYIKNKNYYLKLFENSYIDYINTKEMFNELNNNYLKNI